MLPGQPRVHVSVEVHGGFTLLRGTAVVPHTSAALMLTHM